MTAPPSGAPRGPRAVPSGVPSGRLEGLEDRALVELVEARGTDAGDALEVLYARYGRACYGLARRILADAQFAQDVVQEVFLTLWRDASRFDASRGGFSTWLLTMTHHKSVDAVRREENLRKRRTTADALDDAVSQAPEVVDEVWTSMRRTRVREALAMLPAAQREALALAYFGGHTQREIAGLTSTPLGTVKTRMLAGMRRLRDQLDGISPSAALVDPRDPGDPTPAPRPEGL